MARGNNVLGGRWRGFRLSDLILVARTCSICGELKMADEFYRQKKAAGGRCAQCKVCHSKRTSAHTRARGARRKEEGLRYHKHLQHGMTDEEFLEFISRAKCDACGTEDPGGKGWHVDHDHECCDYMRSRCGKCVRGLLCQYCNTALGLMRDSPTNLRALLVYIEGHIDKKSHERPELLGD